jgi:hypothetical protein
MGKLDHLADFVDIEIDLAWTSEPSIDYVPSFVVDDDYPVISVPAMARRLRADDMADIADLIERKRDNFVCGKCKGNKRVGFVILENEKRFFLFCVDCSGAEVQKMYERELIWEKHHAKEKGKKHG